MNRFTQKTSNNKIPKRLKNAGNRRFNTSPEYMRRLVIERFIDDINRKSREVGISDREKEEMISLMMHLKA